MGSADLTPGKYINESATGKPKKNVSSRGGIGHGERFERPQPQQGFGPQNLTPAGQAALKGLAPGGGGIPGGKPATPAQPQMRAPVYENATGVRPWAIR